MANETVITIIGNLTGDPELRFTPSGAAVANFSIASTPRTFDRSTNEWRDGETLFMRCSCWRDMAENVVETLKRGYRVVATGRLKQRSYDDNEGNKRTVVEMEVDEIGPSLKFVTATINRAQRQQGVPGEPAHSTEDPWATPQQAQPWGQPAQGPPPQQGPGLPPPQQQPQSQQPQPGLRAVPVEDPPIYNDPPF